MNDLFILLNKTNLVMSAWAPLRSWVAWKFTFFCGGRGDEVDGTLGDMMVQGRACDAGVLLL